MKICTGTMVDTDYAGDDGDHGEQGEYSHYTGNDDGDYYSSYYAEKEPESKSYRHSENYSSGDGDDGSYETHSSYSSNDNGETEEGDHY